MGDRSAAGSGIQYPCFSLRARTIKSRRLLVEERNVDFFYLNKSETFLCLHRRWEEMCSDSTSLG
jgi:hypothetical protein